MGYIAQLNIDDQPSPIASSIFGICNSEPSPILKVVDLPDFDEPIDGVTIYVLFKKGNDNPHPMLQVGNDEARYVMWANKNLMQDLENNDIMSFTYYNGYWKINTNGFYSTVIVRNISATSIDGICATGWVFYPRQYFVVTFLDSLSRTQASGSDPTLFSINGTTGKPLYINGVISSADNGTVPAGMYVIYYDGDAYYIRTDGTIPADIYGTVNGHTIGSNVPANAYIINSSGKVNVAHGGTGRDTLASGEALIGNGTSGINTRPIFHLSSKTHLSYTTETKNNLIDKGALAYWNGAFNSNNASNLTYCAKGAFGTLATKDKVTTGLVQYPKVGAQWGAIPIINKSDGVMEIGKYLDFHNTNAGTSDFTFRLSNNTDGVLAASGTITQGSSRKIKEHIEDISISEAKNILNLRPVKFDYINGSTDERGFIAEEVAEVYPNLVVPEDEEFDIPASLNYIGIIPYLVKVIQDQEKRLNEQEKRIKELEK